MYMRVSWGRVEPGKWDEYEAAYKEGAAAAGRPPGLQGHSLARDIEDPDTGYSLMWWDSAEHLRAYEESEGRETHRAKILPFFPSAFVVNRLETVFEEEFS
jgi:heme-degrading monooxygenase HmoA